MIGLCQNNTIDAHSMAINADLRHALEAFVTKLVARGCCDSKSELLREGIRLVQEREARLATLDGAIARGIADAGAGRAKSAAAVFDRLEAKYRGQVEAKGQ